jgi:purine-binding chemotaxis protein CheW
MDNGASIDDRELELLKARARALAMVPAAAPGKGDLVTVVQFSLGIETYAVEHRYIREVLPLPRVTRVPGVPSFVRGIINVRGRTVSILDVKLILGLPETTFGLTSHLIILQSADMEFGILADAIVGLASIPISIIQPSLPTLRKARGEFLSGVTADGLVLLDAGKLLADTGLVVDETVGSAT